MGDGSFRRGDRSVMARSRFEWRAQRFECAPGHQRGRWARFHYAAEYLGRGLARAETADRLDAHKRRTRRTDAARGRASDALELSHRAHVVLAVVPNAVLPGRGKTLPVSEHRRAIMSAGCSHV